MVDKITEALGDFEALVKGGGIVSFWISVRNNELQIQADNNTKVQKLPLPNEMFDSLHTFFFGIEKIEYGTHDYSNLKSFINARVMLDRILNQ